MIWNPGYGSDRIEGGRGRDIAQINDGDKGNHFIVSANGQRVTTTRDTGAPFFVDIGTTETLDLNMRGGKDSVDVNKGLASLIKVDIDAGKGDDLINAHNGSRQHRRRPGHRPRRRRRERQDRPGSSASPAPNAGAADDTELYDSVERRTTAS